MRVANWDVYQSYRADRGQPPWIKVHRKLLRNHQWVVMSASERGQLVAMWLLAADNDGELPDDPELIKRLCYMSSDEPLDLQRFVSLGFLEVDAEVASRWRQHDRPKAEAEAKAEAETEADISLGKPRALAPPDRYTEDNWTAFWSLYPRKVGKRTALVAFKASCKRAEPVEIIDGARRLADHVCANGVEMQFVPHASTWLRRDGWEDQLTGKHDAARDAWALVLEGRTNDQ